MCFIRQEVFLLLSPPLSVAPKVNILLSVYNGEAYLSQQLESILDQTYPSITVTARNDGSTDNSEEILRHYATGNAAIRIISGSRMGMPGCFFELLRLADEDAQFYGLADQDDVWHREKVGRAVEMLSRNDGDGPLLYFSRVEFVDARLRHLGYSRVPTEIGFHNALVENIAPGCTAVINRGVMDLLRRGCPERTRVHDHWLYLVAAGFGKIVYDSMPLLKYRQHQRNLIGGSSLTREIMAARAARFFRLGSRFLGYFDQAAEFHRIYGNLLPSNEMEILRGFLSSKSSLRSRLRYALRMRVRRQNALDNNLLRLLIVLGAY